VPFYSLKVPILGGFDFWGFLSRKSGNKFYHITDLIEKINKTGKVAVFPVAEKSWYDIGQWKEYQDTLLNYK